MSLVDYNWKDSHWETERKVEEQAQEAADKRSPFERDRARIIHSVAFRKLQGKTQIFAPGQAEFLRTRVTHSIEVAQIGRSLADNAGIPTSLVEAACLAHDLGHPPFGHTGEEILNKLMKDYGGFEGNAQTFRILTRLEEKSAKYRGLNLCRATLLGVLKYPYRRSPGQEKFLYDDDASEYEEWLFNDLQMRLSSQANNQNGQPSKTIVCQLMDWADDVAYSVHDLEDGLQCEFLFPSLPMERVVDCVWKHLSLNDSILEDLTIDRVRQILEELKEKLADPQKTIRDVTRYYINRFVTSVQIQPREVEGMSFNFYLKFDPSEVLQECAVFKALSFEFLIRDERTTTFAYKGREIIQRIFEALLDNTSKSAGKGRFDLFSRDKREVFENTKDDESVFARLVCDHIASMTDGQAIRLYRRLFEATGSSLFEPV